MQLHAIAIKYKKHREVIIQRTMLLQFNNTHVFQTCYYYFFEKKIYVNLCFMLI